MNELHTGKKSVSKKAYIHNDIHTGNIVIDQHGEPHFIDFGRAWENSVGKYDVITMLLLFFTPIKDRNERNEQWIFGDWMGEYKFSYNKPISKVKQNTIYIFLEPADKKEDGSYPRVHYIVKDTQGNPQKGTLDLTGLGLSDLPHTDAALDKLYRTYWGSMWSSCLSDNDLSLLEKKLLALTAQRHQTVSRQNRSEALYNTLSDPKKFYREAHVPSALDIAETLTLCRLQLESFQPCMTALPTDKRLKIIHILNAVSNIILELYEKSGMHKVNC